MTDVDVGVARRMVEFLGLTAAVGPSAERALAFRLGVLYPYSSDLRRVYDQYVEVAASYPDAEPLLVGERPRAPLVLRDGDATSAALDDYVAALHALHDRTAFASPSTDAGVDHAHTSVRDAISSAKRDAVLGPVS
ncbi:MAG: hypothetical protein QOJ09_158 [Actinomycetota bacterium]|jgi:hypothetical protein|nr:hypothetical protein [Actinomycetota bacterium]